MMHFNLRMIHFYYWVLRVQIIIMFMSYYHLLIGS